MCILHINPENQGDRKYIGNYSAWVKQYQ